MKQHEHEVSRTLPLAEVPAEVADEYSVDRLLGIVTAADAVESEWLNHLSQLEYIGCRKILKAVPFGEVDVLTLQHIHEEAGHAFLLKQLAVDLAPQSEGWTQSRFCSVGWKYFSELDAEVCALLPSNELAYPLVSFIVEERVMRLYPAYRRITQRAAVKAVLKIILAQEGRHETRFERWVLAKLPGDIIDRSRAIEVKKWNEFALAIERASALV